jgi:hypothetical protein
MEPRVTRIAQITNAELDVLWRTSNAIAKSRRFKDVATPEDALARILVGRDLGLTATDAVGNITFSDGAAIVGAEIQGALLRNYVGPDGERYDFEVVTAAAKRDEECTIRIKRRDAGREWKSRGTETFTLEDAERAELTGSDFYRRYPRRMLFARALTAAIATYAPEAVHPQLATTLTAAEIFEVADSRKPGELRELAADDPLRADDLVPEPTEDDRRITQASVKHVREIHDYLEDRGELQRFADTLDVVGAPPHDELIQRVVGMTENQASELSTRLGIRGRALGAHQRDRQRREQRQRQEARDRRDTAAAEAVRA